MKIIEKKIVEKNEELLEDSFCNLCGKSCNIFLDPQKTRPYLAGLINARIIGGYSSLLGESTEYEFSLCEDCVVSELNSGVIPPEVSSPSHFVEKWLTPEQADKLKDENSYDDENTPFREKIQEIMTLWGDKGLDEENSKKIDYYYLKSEEVYKKYLTKHLSKEEAAAFHESFDEKVRNYEETYGEKYE